MRDRLLRRRRPGPARRRGQRAAAMVEFAIVAPILILCLCGMTDLGVTAFARMLTANATQGMADLMTQGSKLQATDVANIYNAAYAMMAPLSSTTLSLRATDGASDGNGHALVYWSCGSGSLPPYPSGIYSTVLPNGDPVSNVLTVTPNGLDTSVIVVESANPVPSPTRYVLTGTQNIASMAFTLPRQSTFIGFPWDGIVGDDPLAPSHTTTNRTLNVQTLNGPVTCNYRS